MTYTITGTTCGTCGSFVPNGSTHVCAYPYKPGRIVFPLPTGWQCPICKTVWAPSIARCNTCVPLTVHIPTMSACPCGTTAPCPLHAIRYTSVTVSTPTDKTLWVTI